MECLVSGFVGEMEMKMKYDAFISYRHAELDTYVAKRIHKALETYRVPYAIKKKSGKKRISRVFRDQEELPIGSSLTDTIEFALKESEFLIVICSPRTPESEWVQREIDTFIKIHDRYHILAVLIEGEPNESFPGALLTDESGKPVEPLAADVRGANYREVNQKLRSEIVRMAAPLLSCNYDDLRQRHRERRIRKMIAVFAGIAVLGGAFGAYSTINASLIRQTLKEKQISQSKYLAETSLSLLEYGDRKTAALVALEALGSKENDRPFVPSAQYALSSALHCYTTGNELLKDAVLKHDSKVEQFVMEENGSFLVSVDNEERVHLWNLDSKECILTIDKHLEEAGFIVDVLDVAKTDLGVLVVYKDEIVLFDETGKEIWKREGESLIDCYITEDQQQILAIGTDQCMVLDCADGNLIQVIKNETEDMFLDGCISQDHRYIALCHLILNQENNAYITIYDCLNKESRRIELSQNYVSQCFFQGDGIMTVTIPSASKIIGSDTAKENGIVTYLDLNEEKKNWTFQFPYDIHRTDIHKCTYCSNTGNYVFFYGNRYVVLDQNGNLINEINYGQAINCLKVSDKNNLGFIGNSDGKIQLFYTDSGELLDYDFADTELKIKNIAIENGKMVIQGSYCNDLLLLDYPKSNGLQEKLVMDKNITNVCVSKDESLCAVFTNDMESCGGYIYSDSEELLYEIKDIEISSALKPAFFTETNELVITDRYGKVWVINPFKKQKEMIEVNTKEYMLESALSVQMDRVVLFDTNEYYIIDPLKKCVEYQGLTEHALQKVVYSSKNRILYTYSQQDEFYSIDVTNNEEKKMDMKGYHMLRTSNPGDAMVMDSKEEYLVIPCSDSKIRVLDITTLETVSEIPFDGRFHYFISVIADSHDLILKGDDDILKVYDFEHQIYRSIASREMTDSIREIKMSEDRKKLLLKTYDDLYFLDSSTYEMLAYVRDGKCYLGNSNRIISAHYHTLYETPYLEVEQLVEEAKRQFPSYQLTEQEIMKYNIE